MGEEHEDTASVRSAIMRTGLPAADRFLLLRIYDLELTGLETFCSVSMLALDSGMSAKTASRSLGRLEAQGWITVDRSAGRLHVGRLVRSEKLGPFHVIRLATSPPDGGETHATTPPTGGELRLRMGSPAPDGGVVASRRMPSATEQARDDLYLVDPPPISPPDPEDLRDDDEAQSGRARAVSVTDFESARRRTRQAVGLAWLKRRAQPITADDTNERRVAAWIWQTAGNDAGAFEQLLEDLVAAWIADAYILEVWKPWAHLQAQLGVLYSSLGGQGRPGQGAELERELEVLEDRLTNAVSFGQGYDIEEELRRQIDGVRARLRGVA